MHVCDFIYVVVVSYVIVHQRESPLERKTNQFLNCFLAV